MKRNYDKNDVLRYLYGELSPEEEADFIEAMCADDALYETYESLKSVAENLDEAKSEPSEATVERVMHYVQKPQRRERPGERFLPGKNRKLVSLHTLVTGAMILCALITVAITVFAYRKGQQPETFLTDTSLDWEDHGLNQRLQFARMNIRNLGGQREVPLPVYHNTYRVVNTADPSPTPGEVILLNIK